MINSIGILKIIGLLSSTVFALLGLFSNIFNKSTRRLTPWGIIAILGITISLIVSIVALLMETQYSEQLAREAEADALAYGKQLQDILETAKITSSNQEISLSKSESMQTHLAALLNIQQCEMNKIQTITNKMDQTVLSQEQLVSQSSNILGATERLMNPPGELRISMQMSISVNESLMAPYVQRIRPKLENYIILYSDNYSTELTPNRNLPGELSAFAIMLAFPHIEVDVFSRTNNTKDFPDLRLNVLTGMYRAGDDPINFNTTILKEPSWEYINHSGTEKFVRTHSSIATETIIQKEAMSSLLDWPGATIIVTIYGNSYPEIWKSIDHLDIHSSKGFTLYLRELHMIQSEYIKRQYSTTVPDSACWYPETSRVLFVP